MDLKSAKHKLIFGLTISSLTNKTNGSRNESNPFGARLFFFALAGLIYFYPVVKYSQTKLYCENIAKNYFLDNKNTKRLNKKQLRMLSTNFCNGGKDINKI